MTKKDFSEVHLFIIWEHARVIEKKIIKDISKQFNIVKTFEVHWSKENFSKNLSRFYGTLLAPDSRKEVHVGNNPFLAIVVEDKNPSYETKVTTRGNKHVNTNLFEAKAKHREWTGGGHKIHASNTVIEANHNLSLLFGLNCEDFMKKYGKTKKPEEIEIWKKDIVGTNGWKNLQELFYTLNSTIDYAVMRNFEPLPDKFYTEEHGDIDLLVTNYKDACFITNSKPVFNSRHRAYNKVLVGGKNVMFDFRHLGDNYYDERWEENILKNRVLTSKGFYAPSDEDHFYSLLYHALIHKPKLGEDYVKKLSGLAKKASVKLDERSFKSDKATEVLSKFLVKNSYAFTQPNDKSVFINLDYINKGKTFGATFKRRKIIPLRNYIKSKNIPLKHYLLKARKIIRRKLRGIDTGQ